MAAHRALLGAIAAGTVALNVGYVYGTTFHKQIMINRKFQRIHGGGDDGSAVKQVFCVSDTQNNVYRVQNNLYYWNWYATEMWSGLKEGEVYNVKGYGWRFGPLSMYPNLVAVSHVGK
jgi:hypothetical protein